MKRWGMCSRILCGVLIVGLLGGCMAADSVTVQGRVQADIVLTAEPTPTPSPSPSPTPTPAPTPAPTPSPTPTPTPHPAALFAPAAIGETDPEGPAYQYVGEVWDRGEIAQTYRRPFEIRMGLPGEYTALEGITTFRGNNFRDKASYGAVDIAGGELSKAWSLPVGGIEKWTGVGWNGQPCVVRWSDEQRAVMNLYPEKKAKRGLVEVVYAALDGKIRFLDLEDGTPTRDPIDIGDPIKGSVAVDPRGYPLLYVGQGISYGGRMGYRIFSLTDHTELLFIDGSDSFQHRGWRAFDSNPVIDAQTDTLIVCGENGLLYTVRLNTVFDPNVGSVSIDPDITKYRYRSAASPQLGTESSPCVFGGYIFLTNNSGLVQCVDLNTLEPVWVRDCTDDTDSTPMLHLEDDGRLALYTACEVDRQGSGGSAYIRKLDAATGELLWELSYPCAYDADVNGGALASPAIGRGDLEGSLFYLIAKTKGTGGQGVLARLDEATGEIIWEKPMQAYSWSSPVDIYAPSGKGYLIVGDAAGTMHLIDGASGDTLSTVALGANIEGSPVVFGNIAVVGTRGGMIHAVRIE